MAMNIVAEGVILDSDGLWLPLEAIFFKRLLYSKLTAVSVR
jgi:hypothetical protein